MEKAIRILPVIPALFIIFTLSSVSVFATGGEKLEVGRFSVQDIQNWKEIKFQFQTIYSLFLLEGKNVLKAESEMAASAIYNKVEVNLTKTPFLNWSWRVENTLSGQNERTKGGDDFPARIFIVIKSESEAFSLNSKVLNYVWSSITPVGDSWASPYSLNVKMLVLRSGNVKLGTWVTEKRNVREDLEMLFGEDIPFISGVAVMTDTDNSGEKALAYYGDIFFTEN